MLQMPLASVIQRTQDNPELHQKSHTAPDNENRGSAEESLFCCCAFPTPLAPLCLFIALRRRKWEISRQHDKGTSSGYKRKKKKRNPLRTAALWNKVLFHFLCLLSLSLSLSCLPLSILPVTQTLIPVVPCFLSDCMSSMPLPIHVLYCNLVSKSTFSGNYYFILSSPFTSLLDEFLKS